MPIEPITTNRAWLASQTQDRRADFDISNTICVSSFEPVRDAVFALFSQAWPGAATDELWVAFYDFDRLFQGRLPGFLGCDTVYHDIQHSLDVTLAMARLLTAHEQTAGQEQKLGADKAVLGLIIALFHDAGYIRTDSTDELENGAGHTRWHISRSAGFLRNYLTRLGLKQHIPAATEIVHYTGYEKRIGNITLADPLDRIVGELLGTADLITQMADRCYLEKCRDHLYLEFVMGGVAIFKDDEGHMRVRYQSGEDLLLQTPDFYRHVALRRLDDDFHARYQLLTHLFGGRNPYLESIERNITHLEAIIISGEWQRLRRHAPCSTAAPNGVAGSNALVNALLAKFRSSPVILGTAV